MLDSLPHLITPETGALGALIGLLIWLVKHSERRLDKMANSHIEFITSHIEKANQVMQGVASSLAQTNQIALEGVEVARRTQEILVENHGALVQIAQVQERNMDEYRETEKESCRYPRKRASVRAAG